MKTTMKTNEKKYNYSVVDASQGWLIGAAYTAEEAIAIYDAAYERNCTECTILDADGHDVTIELMFPVENPDLPDGVHIYFVFDTAKLANVNEELVESMATFLTFNEARDFAKSMHAACDREFLVEECLLGADCLTNLTNQWFY